MIIKKKKNFYVPPESVIISTLHLPSKNVAKMFNISISKVNRLRKKFGLVKKNPKSKNDSKYKWKVYERNSFSVEKKKRKRRKKIPGTNIFIEKKIENEIEITNEKINLNVENKIEDINVQPTNNNNLNLVQEPIKINPIENFVTKFDFQNIYNENKDEEVSNWMKKFCL
jgi:hypothetical protein